MKKRILINTPIIIIPAGVANHYLGLKPFFSNKVIYNQYLPGHRIKQKYGKWLSKLIIPFFKVKDILKFIVLIYYYQKPVVLLNPSFGITSLKRDTVFIHIAKSMGCKVAVFLHGWDKVYLNKVLNSRAQLNNIWYKVDMFFVLAAEFKVYLQQLGVESPIHLTNTKVNDQLLVDSHEKNITEIKTILFLARIEKAKGIYTTIDAFYILLEKYPQLRLRVVGGGSEVNEVLEYCKKRNNSNITFTGPLSGNDLVHEFVCADIYILPTTHGEGMPTSVLEAMAFGLPVITRPVGGLVDFFENDKMGYMIDSVDPKDYAEKIVSLIHDIKKANSISVYNQKYARENFLASSVAVRMESILNTI